MGKRKLETEILAIGNRNIVGRERSGADLAGGAGMAGVGGICCPLLCLSGLLTQGLTRSPNRSARARPSRLLPLNSGLICCSWLELPVLLLPLLPPLSSTNSILSRLSVVSCSMALVTALVLSMLEPDWGEAGTGASTEGSPPFGSSLSMSCLPNCQQGRKLVWDLKTPRTFNIIEVLLSG